MRQLKFSKEKFDILKQRHTKFQWPHLRTTDLVYFKYVPIASVDVGSFSKYKDVLDVNRRSLALVGLLMFSVKVK
jgi:hypothetical protein